MPRKALIIKAQKTPKYTTRKVNRCFVCGRSGGNYCPYKKEKISICRIHFRDYVYKGLLPGLQKAS
jgi:small subunit ribosomal protein S14